MRFSSISYYMGSAFPFAASVLCLLNRIPLHKRFLFNKTCIFQCLVHAVLITNVNISAAAQCMAGFLTRHRYTAARADAVGLGLMLTPPVEGNFRLGIGADFVGAICAVAHIEGTAHVPMRHHRAYIIHPQ